MTWIIIDIAILLIIFIFTYIGYKLGLIKVAFGILSFVLALLISLLLYKPVSMVITNYTPLPQKIEEQVESRMASGDKEDTNFIENYYKNAKKASAQYVAKSVASSVINITSALIVFILARIILLFIKFSTDLISKLPIIKQLNTVGGLLYGLIGGFIIVYFILTIISVLAPIFDFSKLIKLINSSIVANIMYNNNIIFMFLK